MKKRVSLLFVALLSVAAVAVALTSRAAGGRGWEQADAIARNDMLAITSADARKELSIAQYGTNPAGTAKDCADGTPAGLSPLTVVDGSTAGTFALQTADGKYLAWYSGDYPTLSDAVYANSSWTITIAEGVATIANAAVPERLLQYDAEGAAKPSAIGDVYHWTVTYNETATGIEAVKTAEGADLENAVIYNLNGQRIDKAQAKSGVFIVNGKKVILK